MQARARAVLRQSWLDLLVLGVFAALVLGALIAQRVNAEDNQGQLLNLAGLDIGTKAAEREARELVRSAQGAEWCAAYVASSGQLKTLHLYSALVQSGAALPRANQPADPAHEARVGAIYEAACQGG